MAITNHNNSILYYSECNNNFIKLYDLECNSLIINRQLEWAYIHSNG